MSPFTRKIKFSMCMQKKRRNRVSQRKETREQVSLEIQEKKTEYR